MTEPQPPPPERNKPFTWPIIVNLMLLVLAAIVTGGNAEALSGVVFALLIINGLAAVILAMTSHRIHYVLAFVLSCLVIGLVGFGACALILSNGLKHMN